MGLRGHGRKALNSCLFVNIDILESGKCHFSAYQCQGDDELRRKKNSGRVGDISISQAPAGSWGNTWHQPQRLLMFSAQLSPSQQQLSDCSTPEVQHPASPPDIKPFCSANSTLWPQYCCKYLWTNTPELLQLQEGSGRQGVATCLQPDTTWERIKGSTFSLGNSDTFT